MDPLRSCIVDSRLQMPALVTGIVGSDPGTPFFNEAINELHEISSLAVESWYQFLGSSRIDGSFEELHR
jgi:hypothetical protein